MIGQAPINKVAKSFCDFMMILLFLPFLVDDEVMRCERLRDP
jgi:hypothetical protein